MNLFELFVKVGVDDQASSKLNGISQKLGKGLATAAKIGTAAVSAAATGIAALTGAAIKNYAEYEQLVGGVETLFEDSADRVKRYANEAYRSAGLSANQYMSTVTSFSASLLQSLGRGAQTDLEALEKNLDEQYDLTKKGWEERIALAKKMKKANVQELIDQRDAELKALKEGAEQRLKQAEEANNKSVVTAETQALAADLANQVVIDMSDNVAKMGNNMEMVQNAYRGFARGQYQLLDNLALGYNGTAEEAKRLVKYAARLDSSIDENSLSFDNFVKAIHVVQVEMGIAGTTAKEAGRTIEGSVNAMKSAWTNLVTGIADKNADLEALINNLVTTIVGDGTENNLGVIGNVLPAVKTALRGASRLVNELFPKIVAEVPAIINENLPVIAKAAVGIIESLVRGISKNQKSLSKTAFQTIAYLAKSFVALLPDIVKLGLEIIVSLAEGISDTDSLDELVPAVLDTIFKIVEVLTDPNSLSNLLRAAIKIVTKLGELLIREDVLSKLIDCSVQIIVSICDFIADNVGILVSAAVEIITSLVEYLNDPENLKDLAEAAWEILSALGTALVSAVESLADPISEVISFIAEEFFGIDLSEQGKEAIKSFVNGLLSASTGKPLWDWISGLFEVDGSHRNGLSYVPYDGYIAELHKGERVLTASEAKGYGKTSVTNNITINVEGYNAQDDDELAEMIAEKLQVMTERKGAVFA